MSTLTSSAIKTVSAVVGLAIIGFALLYVFKDKSPMEPAQGCTTEALICPDGSAVGRSGPACAFSPCPSAPLFEGEFNVQGGLYRLIVPAPTGIPGSATYAMPLSFPASSTIPMELLGQRVVVKGSFTEGSTYEVSHIERASGDLAEGTVRVGETKLINRVKVTVMRVTQDSRCPTDVQCIQAGSVTADVYLESDTDHETVSLSSPGKPHAFDSFSISILSVSPQPVSTRAIDPNSYQLTFKVDTLK